MEEDIIKNNQNLYQCKECSFHYKDKDTAEKCEAWCKEHKTCNVEITGQAEESQNNQNDDYDGSNLANNNLSNDKHISNSSELEIYKKKCDDYLNNWKRERADFLNYKKDEMERIGFLGKYVKEDIIFKILPILDNFYLAEKQLPENLKSGKSGSAEAIEWTKGFLQIQNQITEFLKKEGIEEIKTNGEKFNPETMEAVGEAEEKGDSGMVVEELQKGYIMESKVLRPAKVKISK